MEKKLKLIEIDESDLSGKAKIPFDKSSTDETVLSAIRSACSEYSKLTSYLKMEHDGGDYSSEKKLDASGKETNEITFGFEFKTKDN